MTTYHGTPHKFERFDLLAEYTESKEDRDRVTKKENGTPFGVPFSFLK